MATKSKHRKRIARLRINPIECDGIGMCSHVAPDLITVDRWGFPVLPSDPIEPGDLRQARAAVAVCPRRALFLDSPQPD